MLDEIHVQGIEPIGRGEGLNDGHDLVGAGVGRGEPQAAGHAADVGVNRKGGAAQREQEDDGSGIDKLVGYDTLSLVQIPVEE